MNNIKRISFQEGVDLYNNADILELGRMADNIRREKHPENIVTFVIDRNINYTNICTCKCKFCAFYKNENEEGGYVISKEELAQKIQETLDLGGSQILLQGGLHPEYQIDFYEDMLKFMKTFPVWLHAFSPPEIHHIAKKSGLTVAETIKRLRAAGLDSIPGGGAEILDDEARKNVSPNKINSAAWLSVMEEAHKQGLKTTATMMFRKQDAAEIIIGHFDKIRSLQDKTGGFTAFIPWPFQPGNSELDDDSVTAIEYLRVLALARIYLDNIPNIQVSWVTQGAKVAQIGLFFGGNDFGSVMIEENVVRAAGANFRLKTEEIKHIIKTAGFIPKIRNMQYDIIGE
ncbi:cyclic dehypoxanthinyl futalosine synthase [Mucispirillum schaedleri]|jgi:cyclic dehypoxanthinyl futalosine synthase|uniref:Cyclic dehypoxanthine futalosine synthase n=1 Tax=Mucispirillum schaedleri ASF457 TaxID=1379858 RepID=V2RK92_9BACT|nr:cyclic dehypoxanthinyl futalosine synthase [Mucispirillum schaedleri]MCX4360076.1 dehypoxanthine futalosine cyclase [Mucispirillum schaedleri]USF24591.1 Cyclic dehypoxanthine futalosine synthase [Mucispirillum schaedleri ASF457]SIW07702.1 Cyclic dehypoxanthine futalosine synthase [Mucispirillum schaedleri ASF457]